MDNTNIKTIETEKFKEVVLLLEKMKQKKKKCKVTLFFDGDTTKQVEVTYVI